MYSRFLVIDIETTEKNKNQAEILEIGIVRVEIPEEKIIPVFNNTIRPQHIKENYWIFENSTLTREMIVNSEPIDFYRKELQNLFNTYPCVSYNVDFDFPILKRKGFQFRCIMPDPMLYATDILKIPASWGYKWPKVQECLDYFEISETEPHRGLQDAILEAKIILKLIKIGYLQ